MLVVYFSTKSVDFGEIRRYLVTCAIHSRS